MTQTLLIESRSSFGGGGFCTELARMLAATPGDHVALLLVCNGVLPARSGADAPQFAALRDAKVELLADRFSLRERGIAEAQLAPGIDAAEFDVVIDRMADGWRVVWH